MPTMPTSSPATFLPLLLALPAAISAVSLDCEHIRVDQQSFNLSPLGGPRTVHWQQYEPPSISNTTFTLDICKPLPRESKVDYKLQCPSGTRVCGIEEVYNLAEGKKDVFKVVPIAGEFTTSHGRGLDPHYTRLKGGESHEDTEREGVRIEMNGGKYPETKEGKPQKAIVEFLCDRELTGLEGFEDAKEKNVRRAEEDGDDDGDDNVELPDLDKGKSLQFVSYKSEGDSETGVLRLRWKTKYACEGEAAKTPKKSKKSAGWGFFTWFLIIVFLLAATYIIFGSWLNYNRYGARGWDLIPHGDTIRDLPYIIKDFGSNVAGRMKGGDSRGGYSAV